MGSGSPYLPFISKVTFVVCPAFTSTSLSCLPSVSCQTSIFCLPAGTFSRSATMPFTGLAPLVLGAETTALASPLLEPTTTFSMAVSVPHFSVSLLTLSFSTTGAPLYFTSTSTVPPPCAPASRGPATNIAALPTSAIAVSATNVLRMDRPPAFRIRLLDCAAPRRAHDHPQHREREKSNDGRNDEFPVRLRLLQPQIVPRRQRHLRTGLPRSAVPRLEGDGREHAGPEGGPLGARGGQRTLHHERVLTVLEHRFARRLTARDGRQLRRPVRAHLRHALALLPAEQVDTIRRVAHQEIGPLGPRRLLRRELQRDRVGKRRLAVALALRRVVPRQMKRDLFVVVSRAHAHQVDRRIEVARVDDDLPLEQDVARRDLLPEVGARIVGDGVPHRAHRHQRGRLRRVGAERDDVVGQEPDVLGLLHRLEESAHRRAQHAIGEARGDLGARAAAAERPALGQVGRRHRGTPLALQLRAPGPVAAPSHSLTLAAFARSEPPRAAPDRRLGGRDLLRQLELLRRLLEDLGRERLDVGHEGRSEEHTSELQSPCNLVCRLLLEKKKK